LEFFAMSEVTGKDVLAALAKLRDPVAGRDIVAQGIVSMPVVRAGSVVFALQVPADQAETADDDWEPLRRAAEAAVRELPGVTTVSAILTAEKAAAPSARDKAPAPEMPAPASPNPGRPNSAPPTEMRSSDMLSGVKHIIAVASGKGGVGKSTTSVNLALALKAKGHSVGLLDADIYGPSLPRMTGIGGQPNSIDGKKIIPMEKWGLEVMSIGFMVDAETPMIWRGPMVMGALEQLMKDVVWGYSTLPMGANPTPDDPNPGLDYVVVDMPPGTGDIALTLTQRVPVGGAVIVSTPQDIALIDAIKAVNMFRKVDVPILGVIENMSYFACPHCGERTEIFGHGGAEQTAERLGVDFLGAVPLHIDIRSTSDAGDPIVASAPAGELATRYLDIADRIVAALDK